MGKGLKIGICADHAGYIFKEKIKECLCTEGYEVIDFGTDSEASCDYPDFAHRLGRSIDKKELDRGISVCGSGNGISMVLNKYPCVRAALAWNEDIVKLAREHNDANVLSLPARFIDIEAGVFFVKLFLTTPFEGGRHQRRVEKIPIVSD